MVRDGEDKTKTVNGSGETNNDAKKPKKGNKSNDQLKEELEKEKARSKELEEKLKAVLSDREARGVDITELREELAETKQLYSKDLAQAKEKLNEVQEQKDQLDTQYRNLLDRLATIKTTLGDRLKADAEELALARSTVAELEEQNRNLYSIVDELRKELKKRNEEATATLEELNSLRSRLNLSQQNWSREREELISSEQYLRKEYETAKQAMQDWEVIAMEERSVRESLSDRVVELEEQHSVVKTLHEKAVLERDREFATVDSLQRALRDIQEARKQELRDVVENMQTTIDQLTSKIQTLEKRATESEAELARTRKDLERVFPFEKEVKEKNLLIGKLRHEAVTLNDHLRKALRMLQKGNASENVDKQLVSNVFLSFLSIQRGDTKKYEVLQLIASVLDWNDEQRERAGLVRPGATSGSNATSFSRAASPVIPYHRTPSTPNLNDPYDGSRELWSTVFDSPSSPKP